MRSFKPMLLFWIMVLLCLSHASQAEKFILSDDNASADMAPYIDVFVDPAHMKTVSYVSKLNESAFRKSPNKWMNFGFSEDRYWFRFTVVNPDINNKRFILELAYPLLDHIVLYIPNESGFSKKNAGDFIEYGYREIAINNFAFELDIPASSEQTYYIEVSTKGTMFVPIRVHSTTAFAERIYSEMLLTMIFYGALIGLFFYNLFVALGTRSITTGIYCLFIVGNFAFAASLDGHGFRFWPEQLGWQSKAVYTLLYVCSFLMLVFSKRFLLVGEENPACKKLIHFSMALIIVSLPSLLAFPEQIAGKITMFVTGYCCIILLFIGAVRWNDGYRPARFYFVGSFFYFFSFIFSALSAFNVLPRFDLASDVHKLGTLTEIIFLTLALVERIKLLKDAEYQAREDAIQARSEARAINRFLADMSHEIRTPMNGVIGMIQLLRNTRLNIEQRQYMDVIDSSGKVLLSVINDVLEYSKIEAGEVQLNNEDFCLESLVHDCSGVFRFISSKKNIPLICTIHPKVDRYLNGDPSRLRQVILNLISNAFKFTYKGEIMLRVYELENDLDKRILLKFEVTDTGVGISEEAQKRIFQSFKQADSSTAVKFGGTGLGLAISKRLVEVMGGEIGVKSREGLGSLFWFTCYFDIAAENQGQEVDPALQSALKGKKLLIVDASSSFYDAARDQAMAWGMHVKVVKNANEALTLLKQDAAFDMISIDQNMPGLSGEELAEQINEQSELKNIPKLLLTDLPDGLEKTQKIVKSVDKTMVKPASPSLLYDTYKELLLEHKKIDGDLIIESKQLKNNYSSLNILVAEDNVVNQIVVRGLLNTIGISPTIVENGCEAIDAILNGSNQYDAILMDCEMPEVDGYEACEKIRAHETERGLSAIPIIALSAHVLPEHSKKCENVGMSDQISKPLKLDALTEILDKWTMKHA